MIFAGQLLLVDDARCRIAPGMIRVDDDRIVEVLEGEIPSTADVGDASTLITPGFIDAHLHLPQFGVIGAHGMPLLRWLSDIVFPAEESWADVEHARGMTRLALDQLVSVGTTGICAYSTVHQQSTAVAIEEAINVGIRGIIGQVLMDRNATPSLCLPTNQLLDQAEQMTRRFPPGQRISSAITPRFAVACTDDLLEGAGRIAKEHDCHVQTHLCETVAECELVSELFPGKSYAEVYAAAGLLGQKSILGHGVHLTAEDRRALIQSGSTIAHCPTANSFLRSGTMNRNSLAQDGIGIVLGSDIGAGFERSMVRVARAMMEAAATLDDAFPDAATAWHMITAANADRLGWQDAGRIRVGATADLVVIRPNASWLKGSVDPLSRLMFAWDDRWIERTYLRGRIAYRAPDRRPV